MKFEKSPSSVDFPAQEREVLSFWKEGRIFERSVEEKDRSNLWSFYDGPPFATGLPHYGHLLAGTIKDVIPRYWAMRGKFVERRFGWDCHGLPVEFEIQKDLNLLSRKDIEEFGIGRFNEACRSIVLRYTAEWRLAVERMGRWIDFDDDYKTMDLDFMESVWAVFKKLWDSGLVYEDKKVLPYSSKITAPLSNFEANLNYQDVQDPSITVKLELIDQPGHFLLVWTTTPWTLPANLAVAAHPDYTYVEIRDAETGEHYIVLEERLGDLYRNASRKTASGKPSDSQSVPNKEAASGDAAPQPYTIERRLAGRELGGLRYKQLIPAFEGRLPPAAFQVLLAEFVASDTGTGLVHIAPAFGEDDFIAGKLAGIEPLDHLDDEGVITAAAPLFQGLWFKDSDKEVLRYLKEKGLLLRHETISHSYPFCYRSDTPLMYRAIPTWFVRVTAIKDQLIANNQQIRWVPGHLKDGRFGKWLENARDWPISRNRYWGNPIPIWRDSETGETLCVGSREELERLTGAKVADLHKHFIDELVIQSPKTGRTLRRIPEVLDCWFESGSMPYAQQHYPFDMSDEEFDKIFPADFIAEGLDQTRGWFYTLLVLSTALGKGPAFRNVVVNGIVLADDGRKMSKRLKNYPSPEEVFESHGADTLRIYLLQSGAVRGEELKFSAEGMKEMTRKVLLPFWNAYCFLATYASVDGWDPSVGYTEAREHVLDRWISIKLESLKANIHREMEAYELARTVPPLLSFLDDLTNWYIRRSRRRFWKSENDQDKVQAYSTLYAVLAEFTKLAAPFIPFLTETIYGKLRLGHALVACDSVHLDVYPEARALTDAELTLQLEMDLTRRVVELGRELREKLKLKNRQPLATLFVGTVDSGDERRLQHFLDIVREELNVKEVRFLPFREMAEWVVKPNFKLLGKTLGSRMKEFQQAAASLPEEAVFALTEGRDIVVLGESYGAESFSIELKARESFPHVCHSSGPLVIALDANLTGDLLSEGLSRELINRVQRLRKDSGLEVEDRIELHVDAPAELSQAFSSWISLIEQETLSKLQLRTPLPEMRTSKEEIEGQQLTVALARVS